jgi:hypothetical protein
MMHLRAFSPADTTDAVLATLDAEPGATNVACLLASTPAPDVVLADLARECVPDVLDRRRRIGLTDRGSISLESVDTAIGVAVERAMPRATRRRRARMSA